VLPAALGAAVALPPRGLMPLPLPPAKGVAMAALSPGTTLLLVPLTTLCCTATARVEVFCCASATSAAAVR
jgi:hypothetical protein